MKKNSAGSSQKEAPSLGSLWVDFLIGYGIVGLVLFVMSIPGILTSLPGDGLAILAVAIFTISVGAMLWRGVLVAARYDVYKTNLFVGFIAWEIILVFGTACNSLIGWPENPGDMGTYHLWVLVINIIMALDVSALLAVWAVIAVVFLEGILRLQIFFFLDPETLKMKPPKRDIGRKI